MALNRTRQGRPVDEDELYVKGNPPNWAGPVVVVLVALLAYAVHAVVG